MGSILENEKYSLYLRKASVLYKRPEVRASLEVLLSVFTVTFLIFVAIRPTLTNVVSLQKKIEEQEVIIKKADNKITQLLNAQKQLSAFRSNLRLFDQAVPDDFSYTDSSKRVEYLAKKNNLIIDSLTFSGFTLLAGENTLGGWASNITKPSEENSLLDIVSFSVSGKPLSVIFFLKEVENMDRLAGIVNVALTKQIGALKTEDSLKASGQLNFYFYSEKP